MITHMPVTFVSDGLVLSGVLSKPKDKKGLPGVLFLHGAGSGSKDRYKLWSTYLAEHGFACLRFDFRGCGTSGGIFEQSGLNNRLTDAKNAYTWFLQSGFIDSNRICVVGSSMGGHVASRLSAYVPITVLILQSAAAYNSDAESLPLDTSFTACIRNASDWKTSPAFEALNSFKGNIYTVYGEKDTVIPKSVQKTYEVYARKNGKTTILRNAGHVLLNPQTAEEKNITHTLLRRSLLFLSGTLLHAKNGQGQTQRRGKPPKNG
jgi:uncharacterized protein